MAFEKALPLPDATRDRSAAWQEACANMALRPITLTFDKYAATFAACVEPQLSDRIFWGMIDSTPPTRNKAPRMGWKAIPGAWQCQLKNSGWVMYPYFDFDFSRQLVIYLSFPIPNLELGKNVRSF